MIHEITDSLKESTVVTNIPKNCRIMKPWITPGILRCIRHRNKLQEKARSDPSNEINLVTYRRYRNYCNKLLKKFKRDYERDLLANSAKNNKNLWRNIKNITYTNKSNNLNTELLHINENCRISANFVNNYFANIGKQLAEQINPDVNDMNTYLRNLPSQPNSFVLIHADQDEVNSILMNLKSESAPGWDNIPTTFLKYAKTEIVPIVTHLANLCFEKGIFPAPLKQSIITPVYKAGDKDDVNNYRPISVLPAISKILEKLLNSRLIAYLSKYDILSSSQFGFRQGTSTEDAVCALSSLVVRELDNHTKCMAAFLDLQKAFDTVSLPILTHKLERIGIRGPTL